MNVTNWLQYYFIKNSGHLLANFILSQNYGQFDIPNMSYLDQKLRHKTYFFYSLIFFHFVKKTTEKFATYS